MAPHRLPVSARAAHLRGVAKMTSSSLNQSKDEGNNPTPDPVMETRAQLDALDDQLIALIRQRAVISAAAQSARIAIGGSRTDLARENRIIGRYHQALGSAGRDIALNLLHVCRGHIFRTPAAKPRHAFLGPRGTFSETALLTLCHPEDGSQVAMPSVDAAVAAVRSGEADDAVIPAENTVTGPLYASLDSLALGTPPVTITREVCIPVHFVLAAVPGTRLGDVRTVATHPQAHAQTLTWLKEHLPGVRYQPTASTAEAAQALLTSDARHSAAICSSDAAERYQLNVLADNLSHGPQAHTRFVEIARQATTPAVNPTGNDTTSLVLYTGHQDPLAVIDDLASHQVELIRLHSRPDAATIPEGGYLWLDCRGHIADRRLSRAVSQLKRRGKLTVLGSYPTV
ncbi:chorismate mutase [Streptomyces sp. NPDC002659]|uniref:chorismate mutase n=1 Tax=Streptomyces sp. NPDC002659 TaxID=3364656 RepID=UPI0036B666C1